MNLRGSFNCVADLLGNNRPAPRYDLFTAPAEWTAGRGLQRVGAIRAMRVVSSLRKKKYRRSNTNKKIVIFIGLYYNVVYIYFG